MFFFLAQNPGNLWDRVFVYKSQMVREQQGTFGSSCRTKMYCFLRNKVLLIKFESQVKIQDILINYYKILHSLVLKKNLYSAFGVYNIVLLSVLCVCPKRTANLMQFLSECFWLFRSID